MKDSPKDPPKDPPKDAPKDPLKDLMDKSSRSNITLVYQTDSGWDVGGGMQSLASLSFANAAGGYMVVTGRKGSKEELKE